MLLSCQASAKGSVKKVVSGMDAPSINVLTHSGEHKAEKPTVPASGASLQEHKVVLFAFDRAFGTGASI